MKNEFSTFNLNKALKIPHERLREWMKRGYVTPSKKAAGQGDRALFTREDAYAVALFRRLVDLGFSRNLAGDWIRGFIEREKDSPKHQQTEFIIFRITGDNCSVQTLAPGKWSWDVNSGSLLLGGGVFKDPIPLAKLKFTDPISSVEKMQKAMGGEWEQIQWVNYGNLKKQVDQALSILE